MAASTGIVLTATGISMAADWIDTSKPNFRIGIAGLGVSLLFGGIEQLNKTAAVGLSYIMLITVLVTPIHGKSPVQVLTSLLYDPTAAKKFDQQAGLQAGLQAHNK